jgi:hypothetical protein
MWDQQTRARQTLASLTLTLTVFDSTATIRRSLVFLVDAFARTKPETWVCAAVQVMPTATDDHELLPIFGGLNAVSFAWPSNSALLSQSNLRAALILRIHCIV